MLMEVDSVICARTIPKHKAKLVAMVKSHKKVVLAVGDGANDVHMLTVGYCERRRPMLESVCSEKKACKQFKPATLQ